MFLFGLGTVLLLRPVTGAKIALQHNLGGGGATVVALYRKGFKNGHQKDVPINADNFKTAKYMKILEEAMETDKENLIETVRGIYGFKIKNGPGGLEGYWVINAKEGKGKVIYKGTDKPDVTFTISDDDVVDLMSGKLNPQEALVQSKLIIHGDVLLGLKLITFQKDAAARINANCSKL